MFAKRKAMMAVLVLPLILTSCAGGFFSLTPAKVTWGDTRWCVPVQLKYAIKRVAKKFGPVRVHSTHRWPLENWRKGGKKKSYHLKCQAVDFSVKRGNPAQVKRFLRSMSAVGGYSYYRRGNFYHIDTGPRRTW